MNNNTFFIIFREPNHTNTIPNPNQDRYGWELVDNIEYTDYKEANKIREEYAAAMPKYAVRLRAVPIN